MQEGSTPKIRAGRSFVGFAARCPGDGWKSYERRRRLIGRWPGSSKLRSGPLITRRISSNRTQRERKLYRGLRRKISVPTRHGLGNLGEPCAELCIELDWNASDVGAISGQDWRDLVKSGAVRRCVGRLDTQSSVMQPSINCSASR